MKTIVISVDAMITSDIDEFRKRKNMGQLLEHAALAKECHCIYPTYTYPCHTTIATGCYPNKHGIFHNDKFEINRKSAEWFWYASDIKRKTIVDAAKENGLKTASILFPVQGGGSADYLIAEIWPENEKDDPTPVFDKADSPAVKHIFEKHKNLLDWMRTPAFDIFASRTASDIIREFKPDLTLIHFSYVDHQRHRCGSATKNILHAIDFVDERIGEVMDAAREAGMMDETNWVILGDHGQIDVDSVFNINKVLADKGYITLDAEGKVKDWKIFVHSASFSGQVYTKGISSEEAKKVLMEIREEYPQYVERVMNTFEANEIYHLDGPFDFVLEAQTHVIFGQAMEGNLVDKPQPGNYKFSLSTHGYAPEKGPNPPFIISGPSARSGAVIEEARLVDEAPTIARMLGFEMPGDIDGRVLTELIREER